MGSKLIATYWYCRKFPSEASKAEWSKSECPDIQVSVEDVCDNHYLCWCSGIRVIFKSDCVVISLIS